MVMTKLKRGRRKSCIRTAAHEEEEREKLAKILSFELGIP
jgi:hypothetical protein